MMILTYEEYYGFQFDSLKQVEQTILNIIREYPTQSYPYGIEPILYCKSRIKSPESMIQKLEQRGFTTNGESALLNVHDAVGIRIVCSFLDDVYKIAGWLETRSEFNIYKIKDYIAYPKPNGYRSLHLVLSFSLESDQTIMAEIQLRTIAIDFWAALEHQLKYKKYVEHEKTIYSELKRCADEIASVDVSMQTLRDLIQNDQWS
jgi:putative GTP pyrophosphokinase